MSAHPVGDMRYQPDELIGNYYDVDADPLSKSSASEIFGLSIRSSASGGLALEDLVSRIIDDNPLNNPHHTGFEKDYYPNRFVMLFHFSKCCLCNCLFEFFKHKIMLSLMQLLSNTLCFLSLGRVNFLILEFILK